MAVVVAVVGRVVAVIVAVLSRLSPPLLSQSSQPCCHGRHSCRRGHHHRGRRGVVVAVIAAILSQSSRRHCRSRRGRRGHRCHGRWWSVVVAIGGRSLSVGDRRQLRLLDTAVIVTHLSWALHATAATPRQLRGMVTMDLYQGRRGKLAHPTLRRTALRTAETPYLHLRGPAVPRTA